jgi:hypothetical protein
MGDFETKIKLRCVLDFASLNIHNNKYDMASTALMIGAEIVNVTAYTAGNALWDEFGRGDR